VQVTESGALKETILVDDPSGSFSIRIAGGTIVSDGQAGTVSELRIDSVDDLPELPERLFLLSSVYRIRGFSAGEERPVFFSQPVDIAIRYDEVAGLAQNAPLFLYRYDEETGWTQLTMPTGSLESADVLSALTDHCSLFAVFTTTESVVTPPPFVDTGGEGGETPVTLPDDPAPAYVTFHDVKLSSSNVPLGDLLNVSISAKNTGQTARDVFVPLVLNGQRIGGEWITLAAGEESVLSFDVLAEKQGNQVLIVGNVYVDFAVTGSLAASGGPKLDNKPLKNASFFIMITGSIALIVLVYMERKQRLQRLRNSDMAAS
ncbi:hypothetical protein ACFLW1_02760, partial [Chloroflexota bacterium]